MAERTTDGDEVDVTQEFSEELDLTAEVATGSSEATPPPSADAGRRFEPGTVVAERYRIVTRLGKGGMGEVFRAEDLTLGQEVALKFLPPALGSDPKMLAILIDEVKVARRISHPNVCRVYDLGEADGEHFLSMEYIDGEDLKSLVRRIGRLPWDKAVELGRQICGGLAAAHEAGILHRDLKPANLMIDGQGQARITDFGLAVLADTVVGEADVTGTPAYMAPEQFSGKAASRQSDIYALGLVLYELFTGQRVFQASSLAELLTQRRKAVLPPPSTLVEGLDPAVERIIMRCLAKKPEDRPASATEVSAVLSSDVGQEESTRLCAVVKSRLLGWERLVERLGDTASAELFAAYNSRLAEYGGREIDRTDGSLTLFERPWEAVRYSLHYHRALEELSSTHGVELAAQVGLHFGDVTLRKSTRQEIARGARPMTAEGLSSLTAQRLQALAGRGQTLMTHAAFDLARRSAVGESEENERLRWLAHGEFLFDGAEESIEIFEVGEEGIAPLAAPEETSAAKPVTAEDAILGWRPAAGLPIPHRPNWVVVEKLGEGGFGEVWLGKHGKSGDTRVYKFCYEAERLRSLQREITVFRLLKEELGLRDDIARVLDWNLDEAPYFIEYVFVDGGSLVDWAEGQGGIGEVPIADRLEIVAQAATALAAAHSVGVLHKDIKPGNVLMTRDTKGKPQAVLTDFGIGLVTDTQRLAAKGITVLGLTEMQAAAGTASTAGTQVYMAPELMTGQPSTIQADIYALGVMLYQLVVGDLDRPIAQGWQRHVEDELLRGDIASCVEGSPSRRPGNADIVADRLRTLDQRRAAREDERRARLEAEEAKRRAERGRRRRMVLAVAVVALSVFGVAMMFQVRRANLEAARANLEAATSRDVSEFLLHLFENPDPFRAGDQDLTLRDVLDAGAARIETELQEQPVLQARMMNTMAEVHRNMGLYDKAEQFFAGALERRRRVRGADHVETAESLQGVGTVLYLKGKYEEAAAVFRDVLTIQRAQLGNEHQDVARTLYWLGDTLVELDRLDEAQQLFLESVSIQENDGDGARDGLAEAYASLATVLDMKGDDTGVDYYQRSVDMFTQLHGEDHILVARVLNNFAYFWKKRDEPGKAEPLFRRSLEIRRKVFREPLHPELGIAANNLASILNTNRKYEEAEPLAREAVDILTRKHGADFWRTAVARSVLGASLAGQGMFVEAEPLLVETYPIIAEHKKGMFYPVEALERLVGLYEASGDQAEAARFSKLLAEARR